MKMMYAKYSFDRITFNPLSVVDFNTLRKILSFLTLCFVFW